MNSFACIIIINSTIPLIGEKLCRKRAFFQFLTSSMINLFIFFFFSYFFWFLIEFKNYGNFNFFRSNWLGNFHISVFHLFFSRNVQVNFSSPQKISIISLRKILLNLNQQVINQFGKKKHWIILNVFCTSYRTSQSLESLFKIFEIFKIDFFFCLKLAN